MTNHSELVTRLPRVGTEGGSMRLVKPVVLLFSILMMVYALADHVGMRYWESVVIGCGIALGWPWPKEGR